MIILVDSLPILTRSDAVLTFSEDVRRKSRCVGPESHLRVSRNIRDLDSCLSRAVISRVQFKVRVFIVLLSTPLLLFSRLCGLE